MAEYPEDFERFWQAWPLGYRANKVSALKSWAKKKPDSALLEIIIKSIERHQLSKRWLEGFIPNPSTFINQERWNNEIPEFDKPPPKIKPRVSTWKAPEPIIYSDPGLISESIRLLKLFNDGSLNGQQLIDACRWMEKKWPGRGWQDCVNWYGKQLERTVGK